MQLPILEVCGVTFNLLALVSIDRREYLGDPTSPDRKIILNLQSEVEHVFEAEEADTFNSWYCTQFGQTSPLRSV